MRAMPLREWVCVLRALVGELEKQRKVERNLTETSRVKRHCPTLRMMALELPWKEVFRMNIPPVVFKYLLL